MRAFSGCTGLTSITIPNSVTSIGDFTFLDCTGLTSITIPDSVASIGDSAFYGTAWYNSQPDGDVYAGKVYYEYKGKMLENTSIEIKAGTKGIAAFAFKDCTGLTSITIPDSVTSIGVSAFYGTAWYNSQPDGDVYAGKVYYEYKGEMLENTSIEIKAGTKGIAYSAFKDCTGLTSVTIPNSVTSIGDWAFSDCTGLTSITIPDSVTSIGEGAFSDCTGLTSITIPDSVTSIGCYAFCGCTGLTSITIPDSVTSIGEYAIGYKIDENDYPEKIENFIIYGYKGSEAEAYAKRNEITFVNINNYTSAVTAPTCTAEGYTTHTCTICGDSYVDSRVPALGHDFSDEWTIDKEVTCTVDGSKSHHCSRCDEKADETVIEALGHDWDEGKVTTELTCTRDGVKTFTCSRCETTRTEKIDALGHNFSNEWTVDKEASCTSDGSKSHHCSRCDAKADVTVITRLPHSLEKVKTVEPTCTNQGYTSYICSVCNNTVNVDYVDALGHKFGDWTLAKEADCVNRGYSVRTCSVCNNSEREYTDALGHDMGEWTVAIEPTVLAEGTEVKSCSRCQYKESRKIERITIDIDKNKNYGLAVFTVVNAQTKAPIKNANIFISTENDGENTFSTDANGNVSIVLPVGKQAISAYANGCITRNLNINIKPGINEIPMIGLSNKPTYEATVTHHLMTYDEIIEAGIDTSAADNNHVYKYELHLEFTPEIDWESIAFYWGDGGICLGAGSGSGGGSGGGSGSGSGGGSGSGWIAPGGSGGGGYYHISKSTGDYYVYPVSEYFYLIISGEVKWLKEMFDVEMLVLNNSETDTLEDLIATLELPEGLSLATMVGEQQTDSQEIGTIEGGGSRSVHWYVRGDTAGSYQVKALLEGMVMPFEEEIHDEFVAKNALQVWAGNALHLDFEFPDAAFYGEDYPVKITLTNVSNITLYNVSHVITGVEQGRVTYYSDGHVEKEVYMSQHGDLPHEFAQEFKPGDKIVFEMDINIMFESELINYKLNKLIGMVDGVEQLIKAYKAVEAGMKAIDKLTSAITKCSKAIIDYTPSNIGIVDFERKAEVFNTLRSKLFGLASSYGTTGNKKADAALKLANSGLDAVYNAMSQDPDKWFKETSYKDMKDILDKTQSLTEKMTSTGSTKKFNIYDSIRTVISAIPVRFVLARVFMIEDEDNTTSIPWSYHTTHAGPRYFGVSSVSGYLSSILEKVTKDVVSDNIPGSAKLIPGVDDLLDTTQAEENIRATEGDIAQFKAKSATGSVKWRAYIVRNEVAKSSMMKAKAVNISSDFVLSSDNETAVLENGVLEFTGPGTINVMPTNTNGGKLIIENDEGYTYTYNIEVVEAHTCTAGIQEVILSPTDEDDGFAVKCCEVCGDLMEIITLEHGKCDTHTFGDWSTDLEATCTVGGIKTRECNVCGYTETNFTEATGHTEETRNAIEVTCLTDGYTGDIYCSICDELVSEGEIIKTSGHDYVGVPTAPTCTTDGYTTYTCSVCGNSYVDDTVISDGHSYGDWITKTSATCENKGLEHRICSICSAEETREINALGHKYSTDWTIDKESTCKEEGSKSHHCIRCDSKADVTAIAKKEHTYVNSVVAPTCTTDGYTSHTCSVCGTSYTDAITSKTGHYDDDGDGYCDKCHTNLDTHQPDDPLANCSCNCHKSGIVNFFWKLINLLHKLFKMEKYHYCDCGNPHW